MGSNTEGTPSDPYSVSAYVGLPYERKLVKGVYLGNFSLCGTGTEEEASRALNFSAAGVIGKELAVWVDNCMFLENRRKGCGVAAGARALDRARNMVKAAMMKNWFLQPVDFTGLPREAMSDEEDQQLSGEDEQQVL